MTKTWLADAKDEVLRETEWEREMCMTGIQAFESRRYAKNGKPVDAAQTQAGERMLREMIREAAASIGSLQRTEAALTRKARAVRGTILSLPSEALAIIAIKHMIGRTYAAYEPEYGVNLQAMAAAIGASVETELNFRNWIIESKAEAKDYAEQMGFKSVPMSYAEQLIKENGADRKLLSKWKATFDALSKYKWDSEEKLYCGTALIEVIIDTFPMNFEFFYKTTKVSKTKHIRMTPGFRDRFNELEYHIASMQVVKKPMIARPKPWQITN